MNKIKIWRTIIYIILLNVCFLLIKFVGALVPDSLVKNNIEDSALIFKTAGLYPTQPLTTSEQDWVENSYAQIDFFTELMMINAAYSSDAEHPIQSALNNQYYISDNTQEFNPLINLEAAMQQSDNKVNAPQYWWGTMSIMRILFSIWNYREIMIIFQAIFYAILIITLFCIDKYAGRLEVITFGIGLISINFTILSSILNFGMVFIVGFISIILSLKFCKKPQDMIPIITLTGCLTAFLDWMSAPIITCAMVLTYTLIALFKNKQIKNMYSSICYLIIGGGVWGVSYFGTLIMKWFFSFINSPNEIISIVSIRIKEDTENYGLSYSLETIYKNIKNLMFFKVKYVSVILFLIFIFCIIINIFKLKKDDYIKERICLVVISLIPIMWYFVLAWHSHTHFWFTYRSLIMSISNILLVLFYDINPKVKNILNRFYKI